MWPMPTTPALNRHDQTLRALKRRLVKIGKMRELQKKELSDAVIRRRLKVTPAQLKLMREEHSLYSQEASLAWRMRYRSVPKTLLKGDSRMASRVRRLAVLCEKAERRMMVEEPEKLLKPKDTTLINPLARYRVIRCMIDERDKWEAL